MPSIPDTLRTTAARCPDRTALVFGDRRRTYRELAAEVEAAAATLAAHGVRPGDRVVLMSGNSDAFVIAAYAVLRVGAILVPGNPANAAPEVAHLIADSGARAVLHAAPFADVVAAAGGAELVLTLDRLATAPADHPPVEHRPAESDDALLLYTSGTTGAPKGALFDHHRALWCMVNMATATGFRDGDRTVHVAPLYHAAALCLVLFPGVAMAMTQVVAPAFDPAALLDVMERERITLFFGVPTMYRFLLRVPDLADRDLSAWRIGLFGAAPMAPDDVRALTAALPSVDLYQLCGQTEAGPGGIYAGPEDVRARPDASGRYALPNTEARVVTAEGADVAPGEVGELVLRGETIMKGYWNRPEATAETVRDGWLHTGDLGRLDADGYITLVDRLKDLIITGARNVYSVEVEGALAGHPDVADVAVVGVPHPDYGESILAVVVPREGAEPTLESLRAWAGERIAGYKLPHRLHIGPIPRNPSGKIQKHLLREAVAKEEVS
ncbi:class I adenylate-forming enzyme family protein [Pseudonocardia sp. WMMC193]|uniref:class I adenylate-forming enzyme family protein n=1 Tax=Pseudonocardia sp. WMMC193 TaxID=2911965 RepID=UPI001F2E093C|nr:AMP-binding protein [Pseudonocardia sp. WMMC193]MCF7547622.1 AMP-binding protein [Pseudonocardia sp. WMMC193]